MDDSRLWKITTPAGDTFIIKDLSDIVSYHSIPTRSYIRIGRVKNANGKIVYIKEQETAGRMAAKEFAESEVVELDSTNIRWRTSEERRRPRFHGFIVDPRK